MIVSDLANEVAAENLLQAFTERQPVKPIKNCGACKDYSDPDSNSKAGDITFRNDALKAYGRLDQ